MCLDRCRLATPGAVVAVDDQTWVEAEEGILILGHGQRLQRTDTEKMMTQLISVREPDHGQEKSVGNIRGGGEQERGWGPVMAEKGFAFQECRLVSRGAFGGECKQSRN